MRDYWGVSLLLLEMEFYLWCEEIAERFIKSVFLLY